MLLIEDHGCYYYYYVITYHTSICAAIPCEDGQSSFLKRQGHLDLDSCSQFTVQLSGSSKGVELQDIDLAYIGSKGNAALSSTCTNVKVKAAAHRILILVTNILFCI